MEAEEDPDNDSAAPEPQQEAAPHAGKAKPAQIFAKISFLMTGLSADDSQRRPEGEEPAEKEEKKMPEPEVPLHEELASLITQHGGTIVQKVPADRKVITSELADVSSVILIAARPVRTHKYFLALLRGVPCLLFTWIKHCCDIGSIIPPKPYLLPAGLSIVTQQMVVPKKFVPDLLDGMRIELSGSPEMQRLWTEILRSAGAKAVSGRILYSETKNVHVDALLVPKDTNHAWVASTVLLKAREMRIPCVTTEWIIQCIINQKRLPFHLHPEFLYSGD